MKYTKGITNNGFKRLAKRADETIVSYEQLLVALIRAMDTKEAVENFEYIIQMHDLGMPGEEVEDY